jgi:hypothetical protein
VVWGDFSFGEASQGVAKALVVWRIERAFNHGGACNVE